MTIIVDARRERFDEGAAWTRLKGASRIRVAKGKKILEFGNETKLDRDALIKAVMGPFGNLRAPTFLFGKEAIVGFHADLYADTFSPQ